MQFNKINLMVPTRQRVPWLDRFIQSSVRFVSNPDRIAFTLLVDKDDAATIEYVKRLAIGSPCQMLLREPGPPHIARFYNFMYSDTSFFSSEYLISMVGDDMEWKTRNYDKAILAAVNEHDGDAVVYCNDDYVQGARLMVNLFTTRQVVLRTKAPFMCPLFASEFIDEVWTIAAKRLGLAVYLEDVVLKHHHSSAIPAGKRDTTFLRLKQVNLPRPKGHKIATQYAEKIINRYRRAK